MKTVRYILFMSLLGYSLSIVFLNILYILSGENPVAVESQSYGSTFELILFALIMAPIVETFIFQKVIIDALDDIDCFKRMSFAMVLISGSAFGLTHLRLSVYHAVCATVVGLLLSYSFLMYKRKGNKPFIVTAAIHAVLNAISIVISSLN